MNSFVVTTAAALLAASAASAQDTPAPTPSPTSTPRKFPTFVQADTDKDGFLSQAEWDASGRSPKRLARVDTDKDGKVSREELRAATAAARAAREGAAQPNP